MKEKSKMAKLLFYILMTVTFPVWFPLCLVYGIIIGPVGYMVFFFQNLHDNYYYEQLKYEEYLKESKEISGSNEERLPSPSSPSQFILSSILFSPVIIFISLILGIMFGWIKAVESFCKKSYRKFFPIDWRS